jgi:hypothetical protein
MLKKYPKNDTDWAEPGDFTVQVDLTALRKIEP